MISASSWLYKCSAKDTSCNASENVPLDICEGLDWVYLLLINDLIFY